MGNLDKSYYMYMGALYFCNFSVSLKLEIRRVGRSTLGIGDFVGNKRQILLLWNLHRREAHINWNFQIIKKQVKDTDQYGVLIEIFNRLFRFLIEEILVASDKFSVFYGYF